ncbi:MAG: hypothetical protein ACKOHK_09095 [Planctomycetia bacterium]
MSEPQYQPPLHIDPFAIALDVFGVMDSTRRCVGQFDTLEEAEAFVAEANGVDVETVRRETAEHGRMLKEYRENMIRHSRARHKP